MPRNYIKDKNELPNVRLYDNGGKTYDRYTAVYMDEPEENMRGTAKLYAGRGMSENPFHPLGYGLACAVKPGQHLGKRIAFTALPEACQRLVKQDRTEAANV